MCAVKTGVGPADVSPGEAREALADPVVPGDADLTWRLQRAGLMAVLAVLDEARIIPAHLAGLGIAALKSLDAGEPRGLATPAPSRRWAGAAHHDELGVFVAAMTAFAEGQFDLSRDRAQALATGVARPGARIRPEGIAPTCPLPGVPYERVRSLAERGRALLGDAGLAHAREQGVLRARNQPGDPDFAAYLDMWGRLASDPAAWRAVLRKARIA
jgi:hypothetical protein